MITIAVVELISAFFLGVLLLRLFLFSTESKSEKYLKISLIMSICTLVVDAMAYTIVGTSYPLVLRYIINLLAFEVGVGNAFCFTLYIWAFIKEKTKINAWLFRGAAIVEIIWFILILVEFVTRRFITYVDGVEEINYSIPLYLQILSICVLVYLSVIALIYRKNIGTDVAILFCLFNLSPLMGVVVANFVYYDYSYVFTALALTLVIEFIQKKKITEHDRVQQALSDGLAREYHTVWLMDGFGSHNLHLYRSTGNTTVRSAVQLGLDQPCFDTSIVKYIKDNVVEEDQERVIEETKFETIERETPEVGTYVVTYRRYIADRTSYTYHQMCFARAKGTDGTTNYILAYRDADKMMKEQIEQKNQLEDALSKADQEKVLRSMVYAISDSSPWSYEIDDKDEVVSFSYSNELMSKINDHPSDDPMGWVKLVHPDDKDRVLKGFMNPIYDHSGNTVYDETYRILSKNSNYKIIRSVGRVVRRADGSGKYIGMATDLTAQFEEQEKHQKQLAEALSMADAASKAKTDFLFNMSHDIRTPMNAIIGFTNIAKKEINNPTKALESLEKVQLSSEILLNLINDVLDMSRIESGKVELHEEKYQMNEAFDTFEAAMANLAAAKDINLTFAINKIKDKYVLVDGPRFDRVLINIISNAIKYTPPGGFVRVIAEQIEDSIPGYGNYKFSIEDSGIGMSKEFQQHMFEDFAREENSTTSGIQGTGLGLSLAKKLVDMMGGSISCVSTQGIGTTFTVIFPFKLQTEVDMTEQQVTVSEKVDIKLKGKKVLLVEDNELNREIAEEILLEEGLTVETAVNGQLAVNKVRERGSNYYDFILMDIQMPVMNGYEATKLIHELMPDFKAPIIALSANAFAEDKKASLMAGMDAHVAKPINIKELFEVLRKFLK